MHRSTLAERFHFEELASWPSPMEPPASIDNVAINPAGTKLAFRLVAGAPSFAEPLFYVIDLETQELRSVATDRVRATGWLDNDVLLVGGVFPPDSGLFAIDTAETDLSATHIMSGINSLGLVHYFAEPDAVLLSSSFLIGGTDPARVVVPAARIRAVIAGSEPVFDILNDSMLARTSISRWQLSAWVVGSGSHLVTYHTEDFSEVAATPLTWTGDTLTLGTPTIYFDQPLWNMSEPINVGPGRFLINGVESLLLLSL